MLRRPAAPLHARITHTGDVFAARHAPHAIEPDVEQMLVAAYSEPHRAYHDLTHIAEVLGWFDVVADEVGWLGPRDVFDAILFHDAVYDTMAPHGDNEARSATLAVRSGASERTAELIRLTARHGAMTSADVDIDAAHFLDADTAILGAAPGAFDAYDEAIAREHSAVPPAAYRVGRRAFLEKMLVRPQLFLSDFFHTRLDAQARENLARAIARL
jgi:predicted metal-dependent HD superfamily phosphohydrolase